VEDDKGRPIRIVGACCEVDGESWLQRLWPVKIKVARKEKGYGFMGVQRLHEGQTWNPADRVWADDRHVGVRGGGPRYAPRPTISAACRALLAEDDVFGRVRCSPQHGSRSSLKIPQPALASTSSAFRAHLIRRRYPREPDGLRTPPARRRGGLGEGAHRW
jgi:hypothetical protein